jgi:hypothetical protein
MHNIGLSEWEDVMAISQAEEILITIDRAINLGLIKIEWVGK